MEKNWQKKGRKCHKEFFVTTSKNHFVQTILYVLPSALFAPPPVSFIKMWNVAGQPGLQHGPGQLPLLAVRHFLKARGLGPDDGTPLQQQLHHPPLLARRGILQRALRFLTTGLKWQWHEMFYNCVNFSLPREEEHSYTDYLPKFRCWIQVRLECWSLRYGTFFS